MKYFKITFANFLLILLANTALNCNNGGSDKYYKAGNLVTLGYPVETRLKYNLIRKYLDTLILFHGYSMPEKWKDQQKMTDLDSLNNKIIYFKNEPEEMYLISINGMLLLSDVYNPVIKKIDWVSNKNEMPEKDKDRVIQRFKEEILNKIEQSAKTKGLPDSLIYDP